MNAKKITTTTVAILAFGAAAPSFADVPCEKQKQSVTLGNLDGAVKSKNLTEADYFYLQIADGPIAPGGGNSTWEKIMDIIFEGPEEDDSENEGDESYS